MSQFDKFNTPPEIEIIEQGDGFHHWVAHFLMGSRVGVYYEKALQESISALKAISLQLENNPEMKSKVDELHDKLEAIDTNSPVDKELLTEIEGLFKKIKIRTKLLREMEGSKIMEGFSVIPHSKFFGELNEKLTEEREMTISGFEDITGDKLGNGEFINTKGAVVQLIFCLSISKNSEIKDILEKDIPKSDKIKLMRERKVLSGMRVLDLGCGNYPDFVLAISSLGATAVGVDVEYLSKVASQQNGFNYEQMDLRDISKTEELIKKYGLFDVVTENIIDIIPTHQLFKVEKPTSTQIQEIAKVLLKPGGYLLSGEVGNIQKASLKK